MFVIITIANQHYAGVLNTYATYDDAYNAACKLVGWWEIEQVA